MGEDEPPRAVWGSVKPEGALGSCRSPLFFLLLRSWACCLKLTRCTPGAVHPQPCPVFLPCP